MMTCKNSNNESVKQRIVRSVKEVLPNTTKTCIWIVRLTVVVSLLIVFLQYFNILPLISDFLSPAFNLIGLPGEAALPFVTGYFVNVYAAISVMTAFDFDVRVITILSVMVMCAHNMITETAVQKKSGTSAVSIVLCRTLMAFVLAFCLNKILPGHSGTNFIENATGSQTLAEMLKSWLFSTGRLVLKMVTLIYILGILQKLMNEFGVINKLAKCLLPLLSLFGLPAKTAFLWIVANTLGLAYGAAVMIDESKSGKLHKRDIDLLNYHICISHSNFEDLFLLSAVGATWYVLLLTRWVGSMALVWGARLEYYVKEQLNRKR